MSTNPLRLIAVLVIICAFLEFAVFNYGNLRSLGNEGTDLLTSPAVLTEHDNVIEVSSLPSDTNSIKLTFGASCTDQGLVDVSISIKDEGNSVFYDIGHDRMALNNQGTQYLHLHSYGAIEGLQLKFGIAETEQIELVQIISNPNWPFRVSPFRIALYILVIAFIVVARKRGLRSVPIEGNEARLIRCSRILICAFIVISSCLLLCKPIYVGVATPTYNADRYEGNGAFTTFVFSDPNNPEADRYHIDRYYELAKALAHGQVKLELEPPSWMANVDNPYDPHTREQAVQETNEEYKWDVAYYDGAYYVYFGIVPCILLYLPMYLLTGMTFPAGIGVLLGVLGYGVGLILLLRTLALTHFKQLSIGSYLLVSIGALASSALLFPLMRATAYCLPMVWGLLFAVWASLALLKAYLDRKYRYFIISGVFYALVLGCRPQLGISMLASILVFVMLFKSTSGISHEKQLVICHRVHIPKTFIKQLACFITPIVVIGFLLGLYNFLRFGSFFDFGASYNLTTNDMTYRGFSLGLALQGLFLYLMQPPNVAFEFPYAFATNMDTSYLGLNITEPMFGGAFATLPFLWFSFLSLRKLRTQPWAAFSLALCAAGLVIAVFDAVAAGVLGRYMVDFCPFFAVSAAISYMNIESNNSSGISKGASQFILVILVAATLAFSFLLFLAFFNTDGGSTVGVNQFSVNMWGRLKDAFGLRL